MRYQVDPDFAVGHVAFQLPPETEPATVRVAFAESVALTDEPVEVPVRMLIALQAGTIVDGEVGALAVGTATDNAPRSAATAVTTKDERRGGRWGPRCRRGGGAEIGEEPS